jgi:hypothetical protein
MVFIWNQFSSKTEPRPAGSAKGAVRTRQTDQALARAALRFCGRQVNRRDLASDVGLRGQSDGFQKPPEN